MATGDATPRMTIPTRRVLEALLERDDRYGGDLGPATDLPSGTVHPILARLEGVGWVSSRWEDVDPSVAGRPARRYYRLTPEGRDAAEAALARVAARSRSGVPRLARMARMARTARTARA